LSRAPFGFRRLARLALAALLALAAVPAAAQGAPPPAAKTGPSPGEMVLGRPRAKVTVIEYASVGCPHCATWANEVFPEFRRRYIDTGQVRFVFREMLTGNGSLAAAGFLTARCAGPDKYFQVVDDVFAGQQDIERDGIDALARIAQRAGLPRDKFEACLQDEAALHALVNRTRDDAAAHGIDGTPTFIVGDQTLAGEQSLDILAAAIAKAKH
jgi:protein-disulfide isomerase